MTTDTAPPGLSPPGRSLATAPNYPWASTASDLTPIIDLVTNAVGNDHTRRAYETTVDAQGLIRPVAELAGGPGEENKRPTRKGRLFCRALPSLHGGHLRGATPTHP